MATSEALSFNVASVVEDVLQQHGGRPRGIDLDSRRAEAAGIISLLFQFSFFILL